MTAADRNDTGWAPATETGNGRAPGRRQKYGLVWDDEQAGREFREQDDTCLPLLAPDMGRTIAADPAGPIHILIEGDNYHALAVLACTHAQAIDVIYIDPPYNTGAGDFRYNDRYTDREDAYRHSKWLSFMAPRLRLARDLLKPTGLIMISIDDNELAQLRLLCDDIFQESNFRNTIVMSRVKKNIRERALVRSLNAGHGTVLIYARSPEALIRIPTRLHPKRERWHSFDAPGIRPTMQYELFGLRPPEGRHWMYEETRAREMVARGALRPNPQSGRPEYRLEASDITMLDTNWTDLQEGDSSYLGNGGKNPAFIKRLLGLHPARDAVVLDFFAGSGTTGQAVIELNREDDGTRRCLLATNDENKICTDVCYPRLQGLLAGRSYEGRERTLLFEEELTLTRLKQGQEIYHAYQQARAAHQGQFDELKGELEDNVVRLWGIRKVEGWQPGSGGSLRYYRVGPVPAGEADRDPELIRRTAVEMLCLAENTFDRVDGTAAWALYEGPEAWTALLLDPAAVEDLKAALGPLGKPVKLYSFLPDGEEAAQALAALAGQASIQTLPEPIRRALAAHSQ